MIADLLIAFILILFFVCARSMFKDFDPYDFSVAFETIIFSAAELEKCETWQEKLTNCQLPWMFSLAVLKTFIQELMSTKHLVT